MGKWGMERGLVSYHGGEVQHDFEAFPQHHLTKMKLI